MVFPLLPFFMVASTAIGSGISLWGQNKQTKFAKKERFLGLTSERDALMSEVEQTSDTLESKIRQGAAMSNLYTTGTESITRWADTQKSRIERNYGLKTRDIGKGYGKKGTAIWQKANKNSQSIPTPPSFPSL
jgi:hypothetical protein